MVKIFDGFTVGYAQDEQYERAKALATQLHFILNKEADRCLFVDKDKLSLKIPGFSPMFADFSAEFWEKRRAEGKKQGIIRACKPTPGLKILDATAGWGRDSAVLASFGAKLVMLERHPVMASLLSDALARQNERDREQLNIRLYAEDALTFLSSLEEADYPDVIYLDPMHPARSKAALVKKEMQALQQIIGPDEDVLQLIQLALTRAKQKVVVKWPQKVKAIIPASGNVAGKTVRFDIYSVNMAK